MAYATSDSVYDKVGVTSTEITSAEMTRILSEADAEVDRLINTTCTPQTRFEIQDGNGENSTVVEKKPLLSLKALEINDTTISLTKLRFYPSGFIKLLTTAEKAYFYTSTDLRNVRLKYLWGWMEESTTTDAVTTTAVTAGATATVTVVTGASFTVGDYIKIIGFDGWEEVTRVDAINSNDLTCNCIYAHEVGSQVVKLQVPVVIQKLASVIATIMGALHMVGSTYTFATSYSVPDHSVTKGVPYPHFQKVLDEAIKERDFLLQQIPRWIDYA